MSPFWIGGGVLVCFLGIGVFLVHLKMQEKKRWDVPLIAGVLVRADMKLTDKDLASIEAVLTAIGILIPDKKLHFRVSIVEPGNVKSPTNPSGKDHETVSFEEGVPIAVVEHAGAELALIAHSVCYHIASLQLKNKRVFSTNVGEVIGCVQQDRTHTGEEYESFAAVCTKARELLPALLIKIPPLA